MAAFRRYDGRPHESIGERHVQAIWYDRNLRPKELVTRSGESLRVVDPGVWNLAAGPDFKDAVLEVGSARRRLRGDVEIHLNPSDWSHHGHGTDPAYARVVAHVTWGCGPEPATLPPGAISVWLGRFVTANVLFSPEEIDLTAYPFASLPADERPCEVCFRAAPDRARELLTEAGRHRLRRKAERFARLLSRPGMTREQVFYSEVMAALGYRRNEAGFRRIAGVVPYAQAVAEPDVLAEAMLSAAAFIDWNRLGTRPGNSPEARLTAAAALFVRPSTMELAGVSDCSPAACRRIVGRLSAGRLMGRGRAAAVLANVIVPFAMAERRLAEAPDWLPPEDVSEPVRLTAFRFFGRDHNPAACYARNGLHIQGLLQIHRDCCLQVHPDCRSCPLLERHVI